MNDPENINKVIAALLTVPEKKLLILQLVNSISVVNGELDYQEVSNKQLEINLAIQEAKVYGSHTMMAVDSLVRLRAIEEV